MRVIKNGPVVERKPVTIEFTPREVDLLYEICRNIGGNPHGPRGFLGELNVALKKEGAVNCSLIDKSFGCHLVLKDSW